MFSKERRGGIERKILTSILVVGITPIILTLAVGFFVVQQAQRNAVNNTLSIAAYKTAGGLLLSLDSRLRTVRALAKDPDIVSALTAPNALTPEAIQSLKSRLNIESQNAGDGPSTYSLYDMSGTLILTTGEFTGEEDAHSNWAEGIHDAKFVGFREIPQLVEGAAATRPVARAAAPVLSPKTNDRVGFLVEDQGIASLIKFALGQSTDTTTLERDRYQFAYVNERGGLALIEFSEGENPELKFRTNVDMRLQRELAGPDRKQTGRMQLSGYKFTDEKENVYMAYHGLFPQERGNQIYILVYRSTVATWWPIIRWAMFTILGGIIVIAIFCVIAFRNIHNNIVRPLALLNEGAQIIRQGDLELKLKIGTGDEIEELASSFNKMALALSHNIRQLEDSEEKYRSLFTSMRDGVYQTDLDGVITFINPAGAEIFGYDSVEDAVGNNLQELFLEEIDFARISSQLTKRSFIERTRVWMKRRDGKGICVELSGNRVLDDEGQPVGIEVIFRDVTTSVRLEQQARERSERISAINQIANVINSSLEAGRLHESLVVELNKMINFDYAAVSMYDEGAGEFETLQLWPERAGVNGHGVRRDGETSCAAWVAREKRYLLINDLLAGGDAHAGEFPAQMASCLCVPLYATGRIMGTLNLGSFLLSAFSQHDIEVLGEISPHIAVAMRNARLLENLQLSLEEVTRARERLHEVNEELKTLDEMKTNLLSNVSHELRTPLVAVMGYTDMIFNRKVGPINETQAEYLGIILRNVEKLVALIENLLDFSRLHRGTEKLVFDTFDLLDCVRISMQTIQPVADSRSITLNLVASHDTALMEGDKGKMGQVFNNLLSNAVKFNHTGGAVTIDINKRDDTIEVAVCDSGIGIPTEALDKVFTRFYQYDSSSTRKYGGTGIGLSIAQDIVRLHGSRITVTSEVGKGSVFRFVLPLSAAHAEEAASSLAPPLPSNTHLLIELITRDRALNGQIRDLLAPEGMDLIHASNAPDAVALAQKYTPTCLLVDMEVSGKGRGLLDDLLADPVAGKIPLIMMTNDDKLYESYAVNVAARVKRDFRKSSLLSGIHYALGHAATLLSQVGSKILCVDDDPEILVFLSRCLEAEGYNIDQCSSGQEALQAVATLKYGLVLLDIAMPGLDGWEVCRRIKLDPTLAGIRVYFLTAKPIDRTKKRVQEVGADGYFLKPFRGDDLIDLVKDLFPQPRAEEA
ncbi:MAG: ATP-binding protein [Candidatus Hydrogenedentes bacterium]|nr:ATP-binding protein [Candidatus Hydrogenedentota bacterium]